MITGVVNKIIVGGIQSFAKKLESTNDTTQLRVYFNKDQQVMYDACVNWQPKETVSFKQILNKKLDLLGYEQMATPIFDKSLRKFSEEKNIKLEDTSVFIFWQNKKIGLCVFNKSDHLHTVPLSSHLSDIM
tara:strand:+ start:1540 stop:1932 length:393 start_codon:yes stop_codon:yes gene_type:complete